MSIHILKVFIKYLLIYVLIFLQTCGIIDIYYNKEVIDMGEIRERIAKNILFYRTQKGLTKRHVAEQLGVSPPAVTNWEKGSNSIDIETLFNLCTLLGISINQIYGIEEESISPDNRRLLDLYNMLDAHGKEVVDTNLNLEYKRIETIRAPKEQEKESNIIKFPKREAPLYDIRVSAGTGQFLDSSSYTMIIMEEDEPPETSFLVTVTGDSMEPTYYSGDTLYIKQQPEIKVGEIGLFMINGNVFVKELAEEGLKSHNPKYPEIYFHDTDAIHCYGKVLGVREISTKHEHKLNIVTDQFASVAADGEGAHSVKPKSDTETIKKLIDKYEKSPRHT